MTPALRCASLGSLANILDPEVIVLSGGVIHQGPDWRSQTWKDSVHEGYASQRSTRFRTRRFSSALWRATRRSSVPPNTFLHR